MSEPNKFRRWRHAQGWTLEDISGLTGVSVSNLSRIENGLVNPSPATRVQIAHSLGLKVRELWEPITDGVME